MPKFLVGLSALLLLCIFSSCQQKSTTENQSLDLSPADSTISLKQDIEDLIFNLPSPSEVPYAIQTTGITFNSNLANTFIKDGITAQQNEFQALLLGYYAADIGYFSSYGKVQEAIDYMNKSKNLSDNLGVTGVFDLQDIKKFENNLNNKDSAARVLDETIKKLDKLLVSDSRNKLAAFVVVGSFLEGLYITSQLMTTYPKPWPKQDTVANSVTRVLLEQKKSISTLIKLLGNVEESELSAKISGSLEKMKILLDEMKVDDNNKSMWEMIQANPKKLNSFSDICANVRNSLITK